MSPHKPRGHPSNCSCATRGEECEEGFALKIMDWARLNGWLVDRTPTWRPTGTTLGVPDLRLVGHGRVIWAELKRKGGILTRPQKEWYWALVDAPGEVYVWCPDCWSEIENRLRRPDRGPRIPPREYDEQP